VREKLAEGLFYAICRTETENDLSQWSILIGELRHLADEHPQTPIIHRQLAMGLAKAIYHEKDLRQRQNFLDELRKCVAAVPADPYLPKLLAHCLFNELCRTDKENMLPQYEILLDELRQFTAKHLDDSDVCRELAMGLVNAFIRANDGKDLASRDALLDELLVLSRACELHEHVQVIVAAGIYNAFDMAQGAGESTLARKSTEELGRLLQLYPNNVKIHQIHKVILGKNDDPELLHSIKAIFYHQ
jgi:hypothetical protein